VYRRKHAHGSEAKSGGGSMGGMMGDDAEEMGVMSFTFAAIAAPKA